MCFRKEENWRWWGTPKETREQRRKIREALEGGRGGLMEEKLFD